MNPICFDIFGIDRTQANELVEDLNSIEGVKGGHYLKESTLEFKELFAPLIFDIGVGVVVAFIAKAILKFFEKEKSRNGKPIIIRYNKINKIEIIQGDKIEIIENKVNQIINEQSKKE